MEVLGKEVCKIVREIAIENGFVGDTDIEAGPLTKAGDNYMGDLLSIQVKGKDKDENSKSFSMVLKRMHKEESANESLNSASVFATEINLYSNLAPAFREFQKKHSTTKEDLVSFVPKCYRTKNDGTCDLIFLEDLRESGFTMRDRIVGLSYEDCMLVLKSLARLHAFSYAMKQKDPETFKKLSDRLSVHTFFNPSQREKYSENFQKVPVSVAEGVRKISPELAEKLDPLITWGYFDVLCEFSSLKDEFSVITHGDTWTNNMLFLGNPPSEMRFVDYQMMIFMSPTADIMHTLNTSVSQKLKDAYFDDFLRGYHSELTETLRRLGADAGFFTMNALIDQIKKFAVCSMGYGMFAAPIVRGGEYEEEKSFSGDDGMEKIIMKHNCCMKDSEVQKIIAEVVGDYVKRGYL